MCFLDTHAPSSTISCSTFDSTSCQVHDVCMTLCKHTSHSLTFTAPCIWHHSHHSACRFQTQPRPVLQPQQQDQRRAALLQQKATSPTLAVLRRPRQPTSQETMRLLTSPLHFLQTAIYFTARRKCLSPNRCDDAAVTCPSAAAYL